MALSPADFAAYSRATGAPYPESPEERAQMVPEVHAFRQNQLQAPQQQESNSLALGLGIGLGLAGVGGGLMALRGRAKKAPKKDVAGKSSVKMTDLSDQPVPKSKTQVYEEVAAKAEEDLPPVTRPSGGVEESMLVTDPETGEVYRRGGSASIRQQQAQEVLNDRVNELLKDVSLGEAGEMLAGPEVAAETRQMTGTESSRQSAAMRRLEKQEEKQARNILSELAQETPTLTETYEAFGEPAARAQNIDAVDTASDQAAAPVERAVQRNEDVDVSAAQSFLNQQREKLQSQGLSPTRVERVLASNPELIEAAELYASTGDEAVLSRFSEQPASPVAVKAKSASRLEEIPTKELYRKAPFGEFVDDLEDYDVDLTNRISAIGAEQQELVGRRKQLEEDSLMIKSAMDREPADKDSYSRMYGQMQYELQNMPDPSSLNVDIGDAMAERDNVRAQLKALKEVGPQQFLADVTEGLRVGYQVNPETQQVLPGTEQTRSYLKPIEQTKAGGGRRVAEFTAGQREPDVVRKVGGVRMRNYDEAGNQRTDFTDDRTVQAKKTIYGIQTPNEAISERLRPSSIPESTVVEEGLRQSIAAPEGDIPIPPPQETLFVRQSPQRSQDPLKASEAVRRARIEGRDPQMVLRSMGFGV
jgi:hypothetical protein